MTSASQRRLRNVQLTRKYHYRYFGLWIVLCVALILALNGMTYLYLQERMGGPLTEDPIFYSEYLRLRWLMGAVMLVEVLLLSTSIVLLAKFTAHRVAGPYIRLRNTFNQVKAGDPRVRLKFRDYDRLEDLAQAFNEMIEAIEARGGGKRHEP